MLLQNWQTKNLVACLETLAAADIDHVLVQNNDNSLELQGHNPSETVLCIANLNSETISETWPIVYASVRVLTLALKNLDAGSVELVFDKSMPDVLTVQDKQNVINVKLIDPGDLTMLEAPPIDECVFKVQSSDFCASVKKISLFSGADVIKVVGNDNGLELSSDGTQANVKTVLESTSEGSGTCDMAFSTRYLGVVAKMEKISPVLSLHVEPERACQFSVQTDKFKLDLYVCPRLE